MSEFEHTDAVAKARTSLKRARRISGCIVLAAIAWLAVVRLLQTPARVPDGLMVGILLGTVVWMSAGSYCRRWNEPGIWMFLCIGLANGLFISGLIHFGGPMSNNNPTRLNALDDVLTVAIAAWCTHALVPGIVANYRLSRQAGRTFGGRRTR